MERDDKFETVRMSRYGFHDWLDKLGRRPASATSYEILRATCDGASSSLDHVNWANKLGSLSPRIQLLPKGLENRNDSRRGEFDANALLVSLICFVLGKIAPMIFRVIIAIE